MAVIEVQNLDKAQKLLSGIENGVERAVSSAINKSIITIKKDLKKDVISNYNIKSSEVEKKLSIKKATFNHTMGFLNSKSGLLTLHKFFSSRKPDGTLYVKVKKKGGKKKVKGKDTLKGKPFIATMKNGHTGIFQRTYRTMQKEFTYKSGKKVKREVAAIEDIKTLSIPQMLGTNSVQEYVNEKAPDIVEKNLEKEIDRILKGYL